MWNDYHKVTVTDASLVSFPNYKYSKSDVYILQNMITQMIYFGQTIPTNTKNDDQGYVCSCLSIYNTTQTKSKL